MAGQPASVALIAALPDTAILGAADGDRGSSKSSGRTNAGEEDARLRRGEGVAGESESDISSILVHSVRIVGWEAGGCNGAVLRRNARGDKAVVAAFWRGRPTGRFGNVEDTVPTTFAALG